jgi:hypothetical protein
MNDVEFSHALARAMSILTLDAGKKVSDAYNEADDRISNAPQWLIDWAEDYDNIPELFLTSNAQEFKREHGTLIV